MLLLLWIDIFKALYKQLKGCKGVMGGLPKIAHVDEPDSSNFQLDARWKRWELLQQCSINLEIGIGFRRIIHSTISKDLVNQNTNLFEDSFNFRQLLLGMFYHYLMDHRVFLGIRILQRV